MNIAKHRPVGRYDIYSFTFWIAKVT